MVIETDRLIFRRWKSTDVEAFVSLNSDPRVMEFFPATLTRVETEAMIATIDEMITQQGAGLWAVELKATNDFIGFIGLNVPAYPLPFSPCVKLAGGWRSIIGAKDTHRKERVLPSPSVLKKWVYRKSFLSRQSAIFVHVGSWKESA